MKREHWINRCSLFLKIYKEGKKIKKLYEYEELLTIKDLCEYLAISRMTAYKFLREKEIAFTRVGKGFKISKKSLSQKLGLED